MASQVNCDFCNAPASQKVGSFPHHHNYCGECEPECSGCGDLHPALTGSCTCIEEETPSRKAARERAQTARYLEERSKRIWAGGSMIGP